MSATNRKILCTAVLTCVTLLISARSSFGFAIGDGSGRFQAHQWITQQGWKFYRHQFGPSEIDQFIGTVREYRGESNNRVIEGVYDEDINGENPWGEGGGLVGTADSPALRHFWDVYGDFHRTFADGLLGYDSAANRAIKYFTGGVEYNKSFDTDWGYGQGAVREQGIVHKYLTGSKGTAYYWLGHATHLLQDVALPTHSLADQHLELSGIGVNPDPVHDWVDGQEFSDSFFCLTRCADFDDNTPDRYENWYFSAAKGGVGRVDFLTDDIRSANDMESSVTNPSLLRQEIQDSILPVGRRLVTMDALYNIFLELAGEADNYDSRNTKGQVDDGDRGDHSSFDFNYYDNWTKSELNAVADDMVPRSMRATAEIFRFFYSKVDETAASVTQSDYSTDPAVPTVMKLQGPAANIPLRFTGDDPTSGYDLDGFFIWIDHWDGDEWKRLHVGEQTDGNYTFTGIGPGRYRVRSQVENGAGIDSKSDYGYVNVIPDLCALGGDNRCNTADLDALYSVFNSNVPPTDVHFDLNWDNMVNAVDLDQWLKLAASENDYLTAYLRGDTELDRNIDITDFNRLASNFDPDGATAPHSWLEGNFDADNAIDITDFNFIASNFASDGYGMIAIPEPSALLLMSLAVILLSTMTFVPRERQGV